MKKAQAALEFLMTYGWALIAITIVVGAIYLAFDINPKDRIPDSCSFGDSFYCKDFTISKAGVLTMNFKNTVGVPLTVKSITCVANGLTVNSAVSVPVDSGGEFQLSCDLGKVLIDKTKFSVSVLFYKQGMSFPSTSDGLVVGSPI